MKMQRIIVCLLASAFFGCCGFSMDARTYDVMQYGAAGDGKTMDTRSIQKAVDACAADGGGTVTVPAGEYLTGTIRLKSDVTLYLSPGARLVGSPDIRDYAGIGYIHNELGEVKPLVWAMDAENVAIEGEGEIFFNGRAFMDYSTYNVNLAVEVTADYDDRQKSEAVVKFLERPNQPVFFHNCTNVRLDGIRMTDAPCWTVTLSNCDRVRITSLLIDNHPQISNSDGIHISASRDVMISDCAIYAGDDCIAMTCITDWNGQTENVIVSDCIFSSRSACVRVGHMASKVRNVVVSDVVMTGSNRGIAVFAGREGRVENVSFDNIMMQTSKYAGGWWGKGEPLVIVAYDGGTASGISARNVRASSENSIIVYGEAVSDILLENWSLSIRQGHNLGHFKPLYELSPAPLVASPDPVVRIPYLFTDNISAITLDNVTAVTSPSDAAFDISPLVL